MLRGIFKLWPALLPIILYLLWVFLGKKLYRKIFKKKDFIDADFKVVDDESSAKPFSLGNKAFIIVLYTTLLLIIFSLIFLAMTNKSTKFVVEEKKIIAE